jgi:PiT family inorganic phosphate transporter
VHFVGFWRDFGSISYDNLGLAVWLLILLALFFDFLNGFHDAANSVATVVSTRVLSPRAAVIWAAFFNFVAFLVFNLSVARAIGTGIIDPSIVDAKLIAATLIGACAWDLITWYYGLPTSSSHALIGGLVGAALIKVGWQGLHWVWGPPWEWGWKSLQTTICFIFVAPALGILLGLAVAVAVSWAFRNASFRAVDGLFRKGQLVSAAFYSLGHGGNDAQKTMGIIFILMYASSGLPMSGIGKHAVPTEIVLACHVAMGLGTLMGGWRIVKTMGQRLVKLRPVDGFCAETAAASTLIMTILGGIPVSTTHTISGAIVGVGSARYRYHAVRWGVASRVVWAWILTIPGSGLISLLSWRILEWLL